MAASIVDQCRHGADLRSLIAAEQDALLGDLNDENLAALADLADVAELAKGAVDAMDAAERIANIGMPAHLAMYVTADRTRRITLPTKPRPADRFVGECRCPECRSEGAYSASVMCRYWRRFCESCDGRREYVDPTTRTMVECEDCLIAWRDGVLFLLSVARSPRAVIARIRVEVTSARV